MESLIFDHDYVISWKGVKKIVYEFLNFGDPNGKYIVMFLR